MPHSKTPGQSNAASDKFNKQEAESMFLSLTSSIALCLDKWISDTDEYPR
jgi:hypothetical protein